MPRRPEVASLIASRLPILDTSGDLERRQRDRQGDARFILAGRSLLAPEDLERARQVKIRAGDPVAQLLR